jgi:hypothetical protein
VFERHVKHQLKGLIGGHPMPTLPIPRGCLSKGTQARGVYTVTENEQLLLNGHKNPTREFSYQLSK